MDLLYRILASLFLFYDFTSDITRGVNMAVCSTVVALFTTLAIPLTQTTPWVKASERGLSLSRQTHYPSV